MQSKCENWLSSDIPCAPFPFISEVLRAQKRKKGSDEVTLIFGEAETPVKPLALAQTWSDFQTMTSNGTIFSLLNSFADCF